MKKLNLGCGRDIKKDYINLDIIKGEGIDVVWDLDKFPYPFKDNQFIEINFINIIEHLLYPEKALRELYRIAKDGCIINVRAPHFSNPGIWWDLTHRRGLCYTSFDHYDIKKKNLSNSLIEDGKLFFQILEREIEFSKFSRSIGISWFANKFPSYYENHIAYIFTARDVTFKLRVIKKGLNTKFICVPKVKKQWISSIRYFLTGLLQQ